MAVTFKLPDGRVVTCAPLTGQARRDAYAAVVADVKKIRAKHGYV